MVEREEHARFAQARGDVEDVPPERLHLPVQRLRHAVDAEVHFEVGAREAARHLLAHDEVRGVGMRGQQLEPAVDGVVIGDRDEIHAARLGHAVDVLRRRIAVAAPEEPHVAGLRGRTGVDVEVGA